MKKVLLILLLTLYSCTNDICYCTETITDIERGIVEVNEFLTDCDEPYTTLITYRWGNVVIDCR